jgi:hypothetical protein
LHLGQLEFADQLGLRLILEADDADDLVEVEVGDQVPVEHLEPVLDLLEPELGAADQNIDAMLEPLAEHVAQGEYVRDLPGGEHVHVEAEADLELGELEHALHHHHGIDRAALRLDNKADLFRRFIAHIGDQRQLLLGQ